MWKTSRILSATSGTPHRRAPAARKGATTLACGEAGKKGCTTRWHDAESPSERRGEGERRDKHLSRRKGERCAKSGRAKPQAASRVSGGELGRRRAREAPSPIRRGISTSARVSRAATVARCSRLGTGAAVHGYHLPVVHISHAMCVLPMANNLTARRARGALTFLPANRTATRGKIACALRCLCCERSEMRPQTSPGHDRGTRGK